MNMTRRTLVILAVAATLAAGCSRASSPASSSGVEGRATAGPTCPVERAGSPCPERPVGGAVVFVQRDGHQVARFTTDADGMFRVALDPGTYTLVPASGRPFPIGRPVAVTVSAGSYAHVDLRYDTGIR